MVLEIADVRMSAGRIVGRAGLRPEGSEAVLGLLSQHAREMAHTVVAPRALSLGADLRMGMSGL